jgi:hypothetical protein
MTNDEEIARLWALLQDVLDMLDDVVSNDNTNVMEALCALHHKKEALEMEVEGYDD